jgi:ATP-dependent Lon protease
LLKLIRKTVYELLKSSKAKLSISAADVEKSLGYPKFKPMALEKKESIGIVIGLAWTEVGGDILEIEIVKAKGKGGLTITGQLGEVMQESAQAALSYIRSRAKEMGIKEDFYSEYDLHLHVPEGATPKEGPSAGAAISVALASILTEIPVNNSLAMTGEISLQGRVLAIGGIKDKLLAADRFGIKTVLVPKENEPEVNEIKKELSFNAEIIFVQTIDEVFHRALVRPIFIEPVTSIKPVVRKKIIKKEAGIALSVKSSKTKIKAAKKVQKQK